jgi:hypothetical protein
MRAITVLVNGKYIGIHSNKKASQFFIVSH